MLQSFQTLVVLSLLAACSAARADSTIDPTDKFAYGANVGWINLEAGGPDGVVVGEYVLSGRAYGANVGWISFGDGSPANGTAYANDGAADFGVNHDGAGNLSGFAYGANFGWVNFGWAGSADPDRPRIDLGTGEFAGFAYGANVGWINLGAGYLVTNALFCADTDGDSLGDGWEIEQFGDLSTADGTSDQDKDGVSDLEEYFGGTDPNDRESYLRIVAQSVVPDSPTTREVTLEFTSSPKRRYQIMVSSDLESFSDSGLGEFAPDSGSTTTKVITGPQGRQFYRVVAVKPLQ